MHMVGVPSRAHPSIIIRQPSWGESGECEPPWGARRENWLRNAARLCKSLKGLSRQVRVSSEGITAGQCHQVDNFNEISAFTALLAPFDLTGTVVTADALHTQREHAKWLVEVKKAHYLLVVKDNQPNLHAAVRSRR